MNELMAAVNKYLNAIKTRLSALTGTRNGDRFVIDTDDDRLILRPQPLVERLNIIPDSTHLANVQPLIEAGDTTVPLLVTTEETLLRFEEGVWISESVRIAEYLKPLQWYFSPWDARLYYHHQDGKIYPFLARAGHGD